MNCSVIGIPHPYKVEVAKAYIVLKDGITASEEVKNYILEQCNCEYVLPNGEKKSLSSFEIPLDIEFVDNIILTDADKIDYLYYENDALNEYENGKNKTLELK